LQVKANVYMVEPYVVAADVYSNPEHLGRGGWTWYTGSAGWFYKVGVTDILGLDKRGDRLILKPSLPVKWDNCKITYRYMDTQYTIEYIKGKKDELILDGKVIRGNGITLTNDKVDHEVTYYIKK